MSIVRGLFLGAPGVRPRSVSDCLQFSKKLLRLQVGRKLERRVEEMR